MPISPFQIGSLKNNYNHNDSLMHATYEEWVQGTLATLDHLLQTRPESLYDVADDMYVFYTTIWQDRVMSEEDCDKIAARFDNAGWHKVKVRCLRADPAVYSGGTWTSVLLYIGLYAENPFYPRGKDPVLTLHN